MGNGESVMGNRESVMEVFSSLLNKKVCPFPIPDSRFPITHHRFPIPDSPFPITKQYNFNKKGILRNFQISLDIVKEIANLKKH